MISSFISHQKYVKKLMNSWTSKKMKKIFFEVTHWSKWLIDVLLLFIWYLFLCLLIFLQKIEFAIWLFPSKIDVRSFSTDRYFWKKFWFFHDGSFIDFMLLQTQIEISCDDYMHDIHYIWDNKQFSPLLFWKYVALFYIYRFTSTRYLFSVTTKTIYTL